MSQSGAQEAQRSRPVPLSVTCTAPTPCQPCPMHELPGAWVVKGSTRCCVHRAPQRCLFLVFLPHSYISRMSLQPGQMSLWSFWCKGAKLGMFLC